MSQPQKNKILKQKKSFQIKLNWWKTVNNRHLHDSKDGAYIDKLWKYPTEHNYIGVQLTIPLMSAYLRLNDLSFDEPVKLGS